MIRISMGTSSASGQAAPSNQARNAGTDGPSVTPSSQAAAALNRMSNGQMTVRELQPSQMGAVHYSVQQTNLSRDPDSAVSRVMGSLIGDGSKVTLRRVHGIPSPTESTKAIEFLGRDPDRKLGRALVSVRVAHDAREVYEVVFSRFALPELAQRVAQTPAM